LDVLRSRLSETLLAINRAKSAVWRVSLVADVGSFPRDCDVV